MIYLSLYLIVGLTLVLRSFFESTPDEITNYKKHWISVSIVIVFAIVFWPFAFGSAIFITFKNFVKW